jgi:hypothetical protein
MRGVIMYRGPMRFGEFLAVFGGIILLLITSFAIPAIPVFVAGIFGIIGATIKALGGNSGNDSHGRVYGSTLQKLPREGPQGAL